MFSAAHPFATGGGGNSFEYMVATLLAGDLILSRRAADGSAITVIETQTGPAGFDDLKLTLELLDGGSRTVHVQCRHRQRFAKSDARFTKLLEQAAAVVASGEIAFVTEQRRLAIIVERRSPGHASMKQLCELARTSGDFDRFVEVIERHGGEVRSRWGYCREAAGYMEEELLHSVLRSLEVRSVELTSGEARDFRDLVDQLAGKWSPRDHRRALNLVNALFRLLNEMGQVAGIVDMGFLEARLGSLLPTTLGAETRRERLRRRRAAGHRRTERRLTAIGLDDEEADQLATQVLDAPPDITISEPVTVISGLMGVGKSTELERLHRAAIDEALKNPYAPIPIRVKAAEIGNAALRGALSTHVEGLGDPSRVGVHLVIDGLDEAGVQVSELSLRIATMQADWPNSIVMLGTRPEEVPKGVGEVGVKPLAFDAAERLIETIDSHANRLPTFRAEVSEVLCRPLFAILFALNRREGRGASVDQSQLVASVGWHAIDDLGNAADATFDLLVRLACRILNSGGRPVAANGLNATPAQVAQLSRLRIVQTVDGLLSFQLAALTEWFAAHALLHDSSVLDHSVSDPPNARRWRYALVQALLQGSANDIDMIMAILLNKMPATAAWAYDEAKASDLPRRSTPLPESPREAGTRIRTAAKAWLEPWPRLVQQWTDYGEPPTLGISMDRGRLTTAWLPDGRESTERVTPLPAALKPGDTPAGFWNGISSGAPKNGELWPWEWARWGLQHRIDAYFKDRELLADIDLCWPELAWDYAHHVLNRGAAVQSEPLPLADLEATIAHNRSLAPDADEVLVSGHRGTWSVTGAAEFVLALARLGIDAIAPPWAPADTIGPSTGAWWTPEQLRTRLEQATKVALDICQAIVDKYLPSMAPELPTYQLFPARIVGLLTPPDPTLGFRGDPLFRWHIEPLPVESDNHANWDIVARDSLSRDEDWEPRVARVRELRGDLADRLGFITHYGEPAIFSSTPASSLALDLLWSDLSGFKWVSNFSPYYKNAPSVRPRYA